VTLKRVVQRRICCTGRADLGRVGVDDASRTVEVLAALTHATTAIAAILAARGNHRRR
jgi:hypothetical protein